MKTAGIDIGTTTISGVVLEKGENGQAKILETKTVENGCQEEWKLRAMGTTIGCHTIIKKGTEGNTVRVYDLT